MDGSLPTVSGLTVLAVNSPSDLSYSSGASRTSTRSTSPDSTSAVSRRSSPLLDLSLKVPIEHTPCTLHPPHTPLTPHTAHTLLDLQTKMDRNPFQSINDRRSKLVTERNNTTGQFQHQHLLQPQDLISGVQPSGPSRSLTSSNWRSHVIDEAAAPQPRNMYGPFDSSGGHPHHYHPHPSGAVRPTLYASPRLDHPPLAGISSYPNFGSSADAQIDTTYAYCYDRGNGQYTRLIPADMLPPLRDVPAVQQSCSNMIVLPQPRAVPPSGRSSNAEPVLVRSRIDNIVASTPPTPTHNNPLSPSASSVAGAAASSSSGGGGGGRGGGARDQQQQQQQQQQRRPKIYCDKWVHEGVCAFTQQGCKYKHEMPFDKITQHQLGLFHGFPAWWKKHQAELARHRDAPLDSSGGDSGGGGGGGGGQQPYTTRSVDSGSGHIASSSSGGGGGARGEGDLGGPDAANPLHWRHSGGGGEYTESLQSSMATAGRGGSSMSRGGMGPSLRNPIVSYGSPFGPIAPPPRSSSTVTMTMGNPGTGTGMGLGLGMGGARLRSTPGAPIFSSPSTPVMTSSHEQKYASSLAGPADISTANSYATLAALDENSADDEGGSASNSNSPGARLG